MMKFIPAIVGVAMLTACTGGVLPSAPDVAVPGVEDAQIQKTCNLIAANEKAIRSWLKLGNLVGVDAEAKVDKLLADNEQYRKSLEARGKLCVTEAE